ncbi:MAG: anti-sigma factor [Chloroflexia bacterium]
MNDNHEQLREDLVAYALGALEASEHVVIERHLANCHECRDLLEEYRALSSILPFALTSEIPPPHIKERILAQARASRAKSQAEVRGPSISMVRRDGAGGEPRKPLTRLLRPFQWVAVAAIIIGLLGWNISLQLAEGELRTQIEQLASQENKRISILVNTSAAPGADGQLVLSSDNRQGTLAVSGLPQLPSGQVYQFWFARPDKSRDSAGIFRVGSNGEALLAVTVPGTIEQYNQVWITREPGPDPSPKPTAPHYLEGPL